MRLMSVPGTGPIIGSADRHGSISEVRCIRTAAGSPLCTHGRGVGWPCGDAGPRARSDAELQRIGGLANSPRRVPMKEADRDQLASS